MDRSKFSSNGRSMSLIWIIAAGLAIILGGLLLASFTPLIFPTQGSTQAQQVDTLFRFMLAIGGAIFLLVNGVLLFSVIRFRVRKGDTNDGPPIHGNTTLEFTWTVIPAIIVIVLTIYSFQVYQSIRAPQPNEQIVNVVGQRFAWSFTYDHHERHPARRRHLRPASGGYANRAQRRHTAEVHLDAAWHVGGAAGSRPA